VLSVPSFLAALLRRGSLVAIASSPRDAGSAVGDAAWTIFAEVCGDAERKDPLIINVRIL
jgi:hypothetical protein